MKIIAGFFIGEFALMFLVFCTQNGVSRFATVVINVLISILITIVGLSKDRKAKEESTLKTDGLTP